MDYLERYTLVSKKAFLLYFSNFIGLWSEYPNFRFSVRSNSERSVLTNSAVIVFLVNTCLWLLYIFYLNDLEKSLYTFKWHLFVWILWPLFSSCLPSPNISVCFCCPFTHGFCPPLKASLVHQFVTI